MTDIVERLREQVTSDHIRGCMGRQYSCTCGYDAETEKMLTEAAAVIEQLRESCIKIALDKDVIIERLRAALRGLLDEVMCFSVDPPSAALNHAIEEASRALEPKP